MLEKSVGVLLVLLGERRIGLPVLAVRHIVRAAAITPLARAPQIVEGVLNFHGTLIPVLNVRRRFGISDAPLHPDQHFVVADAGGRRVSLRVDRALEVVEVAADRLQPVSEVVPHTQHVDALARMPDGVLVIHDLDRFLSLNEADELDSALDAARAETGQ